MRKNQRYGCDNIALWMWRVWNTHCLTIDFPIKFYQNTFVVIWYGAECQFWHLANVFHLTIWKGFECFQDGRQIALISMVMGLINLFLGNFLLSDTFYQISKWSQLIFRLWISNLCFNLQFSKMAPETPTLWMRHLYSKRQTKCLRIC